MTLRKKTLLVVSATVLGLLVVLYVVSSAVIQTGFETLERQAVEKDLERALSAISTEVEALTRVAADWAAWDDTYRFVQDANAEYIRANLVADTLSNLHLNHLLVVAPSGRIVCSRSAGSDAGKAAALPAGLRARLRPWDPLVHHPGLRHSTAGVLDTGQGRLVVASRPVVTSEYKGPIRGALIMCRALDDGLVQNWAAATRLSLRVRPVGGPGLPGEWAAAREALLAGVPSVVRPTSADSITGYVLVRDVDAAPCLLLRVDMPRHVSQQGRAALLWFSVTLVVAGSLFGAITLRLLDVAVLSRLSHLSQAIGRIQSSSDLASRVPVLGRDEIASLSGTVNSMLDDLANSQRDLRESEERYRDLVENASDVIFSLDTDGRLTFVSSAVERVGGYAVQEVFGRAFTDFVAPEGVPAALEHFRRALAGSPGVFDLPFLHADGGARWARISVQPVLRDGRVAGLRGVLTDVTEQKEADEQLRKLSRTVEQSPVAVTITARSGAIEYVNPKFTELSGYSAAEALGQTPGILKGGEHPPEFYRELWRTILAGREWHGEFHNRKKSGELYWERASISAVRDARGEITHFVAVKEDITEQKRIAGELEKAREAAEAASRAKSAFLANMSHEIRTPMNAILGFSQLLQRDPALTPTQNEWLDRINRSGEHLLALITDVLELSKIESGRAALDPHPFDLHALLADLEMVFRVRAEAKGLRLHVQRVETVPRSLVADESKLRQVLMNLLSNAVKFTQEGYVILQVQVADGASGEMRLIGEVEDTGIGIPAEDLDELGRSFGETRSGTQAEGGAGIGLAITREYVRLMGGDLWVTSRVGEGSVFRFEVAVEAGPVEALREEPPNGSDVLPAPVRRACRVLNVDDIEDNRWPLSELLTMAGLEVREAANGREALEVYDEWHPDLILMDMTMPVMDGYEAAREIRSRPDGGQVVIIAVSGSVLDEDRRAIRAAGADDLLAKPFDADEVLERIRKHLGGGSDSAQAPEPGERDAPPVRGVGGAGRSPAPPRREALEALPEHLLSRMREATRNGYLDRLQELLGQVAEHNPELAAALRGLADRYDYDMLSELFGDGDGR